MLALEKTEQSKMDNSEKLAT